MGVMRTIASILACLLSTTTAYALAVEPPATPEFAPILVEIHPDPEGADAGAEWFELVNPAADDLRLDGWAATDGDACFASGRGFVQNYTFALDGLIVPAGGRLVVALPDAGGCLRLANSGDDLRLLAPGGHPVQVVAWGADQPSPAPREGSSVAACALGAGVHGGWGVQPATRGEANAPCVA